MFKIYRLLKRHANSLMWMAVVITVVGFMLDKVGLSSTQYYILATLIAGTPILMRAISSLQFSIIGIEVFVSIAVVGALCIHEYSEATIVTTLFQLGDYLERKALRKTQSEIQSLISLKPKVAHKFIAGEIKAVTIEDVVIDDLLVVRAGSSVPVDGVIVKGEGALNEASITGESNFFYKRLQDPIYTGTILEDGYLEMKVTKVSKDTTFAKIIALIEEAQDAKSEVEKVIDKFARVYTPLAIVLR